MMSMWHSSLMILILILARRNRVYSVAVAHREVSRSNNDTISNPIDRSHDISRNRALSDSLSTKNLHILSQGELCESGKHAFHSCSQKLTILVVFQGTLYPSMQGCDKRVYHILEALIGLDHRVITTIYQKGTKAPSDEDKALMSLLNIESINQPLKRDLESTYRDLLQTYHPDVVMMWLWFWDFKAVVPELLISLTRDTSPRTKTLLFSDDVHSKREQQLAEQYKGYNKYNFFKRRSRRMRKMEIELYNAFDAVVSITAYDGNDIKHFDIENLEHKVFFVNYVASPWDNPPIAESDIKKLSNSWSTRKNLIFVGNGKNPTNIHAMAWYLSHIAPVVADGIPNVKCFVVGDGWGEFEAAHNDSKTYLSFTGPMTTEDMRTLIDSCKVFIAPIIASTGINTKNVLALSYGIPLVTTPAGATGMCEPCDTAGLFNPLDPFGTTEPVTLQSMPILVGQDIYDFVEKIKKPYYDAKVWKDYSFHGLEHVHKWFGREMAAKQLDVCLKSLNV